MSQVAAQKEPPWLVDYSGTPPEFRGLPSQHMFTGVSQGRELSNWAVSAIDLVAAGTRPEVLQGLVRDELVAQILTFTALDLFEHSDPLWSDAAVRVVRNVPSVTSMALELLEHCRGLPTNDSESMRHFCTCLTLLGPMVGRKHVPFLVELLRTDDQVVCARAFAAFAQCSPEVGAERSLTFIRSAEAALQSIGLLALQYCGERSLQALPDLLTLLESKEPSVRWFAVNTLGVVAYRQSDALDSLKDVIRHMLADPDPRVRLATLKVAALNDSANPTLFSDVLSLWKAINEQPITHHSDPNLRCEVAGLLVRLLPRTGDVERDNFAQRFFPIAFHPNSSNYIGFISGHQFYRRIQANQLKAALRRVISPTALEDLVEDACQEFAVQLLINPTLGITPEERLLLPGFIRNYARDIGKKLRRKQLRSPGREELRKGWRPKVEGQSSSPPNGIIIAEAREQFVRAFNSALSDEEREVVRARFIGGLTIAETASRLGMSVSQVRTRTDAAMNRLREHLQLASKSDLVLTVSELFAADADSCLRP